MMKIEEYFHLLQLISFALMYIQQKFKNEVVGCFARKDIKCYDLLVWFHSRPEVHYIQSNGSVLHVQSVEIGVTYLEEGPLYLFLTLCRKIW